MRGENGGGGGGERERERERRAETRDCGRLGAWCGRS